LRVEADDVVPSPGFAVVLSEAEAIGGGHEHEAGTYRQREHLDVVLNASSDCQAAPPTVERPAPPTGPFRKTALPGRTALPTS